MALKFLGLHDYSSSRGADGHVTYNPEYLVETDDPYSLNHNDFETVTGMPSVGDVWAYGSSNDPAAVCNTVTSMRPLTDTRNEPTNWFIVGKQFTSRPNTTSSSGGTNPLTEPPRIGGNFANELKEQRFDKDGNLVLSSSGELITGPETEIPVGFEIVLVGRNISSSPRAFVSSLFNRVNSVVMWGEPARSVLFNRYKWEQLYYLGSPYYTLDMGFEVHSEGWDPKIADYGTRVLHNNGNANDPQHFVPMKNGGEIIEADFLDGNGKRLGAGQAPVTSNIQYLKEGNLLTLGVPATI